MRQVSYSNLLSLSCCYFFVVFQVVLQLCNILLGGCSLFHLLTIALSFSLLDDEVFDCSSAARKKTKSKSTI